MARRRRNAAKEQFWRQVMARRQRSDLSIRAFCQREGLSEPSFYLWRRELARRNRASSAQRVSTGFVPVQVIPDVAVIEIVLERGAIVRVPAGVDGTTLREVLAALAPPALTPSGGAENASC
jgi:transposase